MKLDRLSQGVAALGVLLAAFTATGATLAEGNPKNGLSSQAFRANGLTTNPQSLDILRSNPLNDSLLSIVKIKEQLQEPHSRAVMEELVKCALLPDKVLTFRDHKDRLHQWTGELGLCNNAEHETGDWYTSAPNLACQELVTACVLARVNALGVSVPLSLRGQESSLFPLRARVLTEVTYRESASGEDPSEGTPIAAFRTRCEDDPECDWIPAYVGKCDGSAPIQLAIADSSSSDSPQLRVCAGIHGCTRPDSEWSAPAGNWRYSYLGEAPGVSGSPGASSQVSFSCSAVPALAGYYSVMTRLDKRDLIKQVSGSGTYPATERAVFPFLEGAFFGNLFDPAGLTWTCSTAPDASFELKCTSSQKTNLTEPATLPNKNVFACYSSRADVSHSLNVAYLNARICGQPDSDCFFDSPMPCREEPSSSSSAQCEWIEELGAFGKCRGNGSGPFLPITTYLNEPCDAIGEGALCTQLRGAVIDEGGGSPAPPSPPAPAPPAEEAQAEGGHAPSCSAGEPRQLTGGLALVALLLRGRRRSRGR